jgi:hypothetical protein
VINLIHSLNPRYCLANLSFSRMRILSMTIPSPSRRRGATSTYPGEHDGR